MGNTLVVQLLFHLCSILFTHSNDGHFLHDELQSVVIYIYFSLKNIIPITNKVAFKIGDASNNSVDGLFKFDSIVHVVELK